MNKIKVLYIKYKEVINYLIFGVLTTLINIISFDILVHLSIDWKISNIIAWIISVLFAYITNKLYVFESKKQNIIKELFSFISFRLLSLVFDLVGMYIFIEILHVDNLISKVIMNVVVVILNYLFSKLFIFKKEEE